MKHKKAVALLIMLLSLSLSGCGNLPKSLADVEEAWRASFYVPLDFNTQAFQIISGVIMVIAVIQLLIVGGRYVGKGLAVEDTRKTGKYLLKLLKLGLIFLISVPFSIAAMVILSVIQSAFVHMIPSKTLGVVAIAALIELPTELWGMMVNLALDRFWSLTVAYLLTMFIPLLHMLSQVVYAIFVGQAIVDSLQHNSWKPLIYWLVGGFIRALLPVAMLLVVGLILILQTFLNLSFGGGNHIVWIIGLLLVFGAIQYFSFAAFFSYKKAIALDVDEEDHVTLQQVLVPGNMQRSLVGDLAGDAAVGYIAGSVAKPSGNSRNPKSSRKTQEKRPERMKPGKGEETKGGIFRRKKRPVSKDTLGKILGGGTAGSSKKPSGKTGNSTPRRKRDSEKKPEGASSSKSGTKDDSSTKTGGSPAPEKSSPERNPEPIEKNDPKSSPSDASSQEEPRLFPPADTSPTGDKSADNTPDVLDFKSDQGGGGPSEADIYLSD